MLNRQQDVLMLGNLRVQTQVQLKRGFNVTRIFCKAHKTSLGFIQLLRTRYRKEKLKTVAHSHARYAPAHTIGRVPLQEYEY